MDGRQNLLNIFANMFLPAIKSFITTVFIIAFGMFSKAQQVHFVYLQTEGGQPFYVKINNKVISSSYAGYLILPKLTDGDYKLSVGFPKNEFPEEDYQISVNNQNEGFLLKNFDKGWGLFNLESFNVIMGSNSNSNSNTAAVSSKKLQDDPFSKMLANVVKDSSILQKAEPVKAEPVINKVDSATIAKTDSAVNKDSAINKIDSNITVAETPSPFSPPAVLLSKKNKDGLEAIYIDRNEGVNDTIRIFIPAEKQFVKIETPVEKAKHIDTVAAQKEQPSTTSLTDSSSVTVEKPDGAVNFRFCNKRSPGNG